MPLPLAVEGLIVSPFPLPPAPRGDPPEVDAVPPGDPVADDDDAVEDENTLNPNLLADPNPPPPELVPCACACPGGGPLDPTMPIPMPIPENLLLGTDDVLDNGEGGPADAEPDLYVRPFGFAGDLESGECGVVGVVGVLGALTRGMGEFKDDEDDGAVDVGVDADVGVVRVVGAVNVLV